MKNRDMVFQIDKITHEKANGFKYRIKGLSLVLILSLIAPILIIPSHADEINTFSTFYYVTVDGVFAGDGNYGHYEWSSTLQKQDYDQIVQAALDHMGVIYSTPQFSYLQSGYIYLPNNNCTVSWSVCSSSKNVSKRSPKRLAPWST